MPIIGVDAKDKIYKSHEHDVFIPMSRPRSLRAMNPKIPWSSLYKLSVSVACEVERSNGDLRSLMVRIRKHACKIPGEHGNKRMSIGNGYRLT